MSRVQGPSVDGEKDLSALFQLWVDSKDMVVVKVAMARLPSLSHQAERAYSVFCSHSIWICVFPHRPRMKIQLR